MKELHWTSLVTSLRHGQCVLMLGQEVSAAPGDGAAVVSRNNESFAEALMRRLMGAFVIAALALLSLGVDTVRWGYRRLRPFRPALGFVQPAAVQRRHRVLLFGCLRTIAGGIVLLAVMFFAAEVFVRVECMLYSPSTLPDWVPAHWWSLNDMFKACQLNDKADFMMDLGLAVIVGLGALAFAVNWLFGGVRSVVSFLHRGAAESPETELSLSSTLREGA